MSRFIMMMGFLILTVKVTAQPVQTSLELADSIIHAEPEWVDLDNDGSLDIMLLMKSTSDKSYIGIIKGDSSKIKRIFPIISYQAYLLADYDRDNAMDIVISGEKNGAAATVIYRNQGAFQFEEKMSNIPPFTKARFADLDDNATPELVVSGSNVDGPYSKFLKQVSDDLWVTIDSLEMQWSSIETLDADGDGDTDLFVSGKTDFGALMSGFLMNKGRFYFKPEYTLPLAGFTSAGDLNGDGFFEILLMAEDQSGAWHSKKYQDNSGSYTVDDMPVILKNGKPFIADFDYDGMADINYFGINAVGDTVNIIQYGAGKSDSLSVSQLISHRFGDVEHNGNLDLLTLTDVGPLKLNFSRDLSNKKNLGPGNLINAVALPIFNRVFMYWDKPADDHTPTKSLTYDVFLNGTLNYQAGEFDLMNEKRLTVSHGNNGTKNFRLLKDISTHELKFSIQAIDNSFHAGSVCLGGTGSGASTCTITVTTEEVSACTNENIAFTSPPNALWFSFADGFLGIGSNFSFSFDSSEKGDTIFYYHPTGEPCPSLKAWTIKVKNDTIKIEKGEKYACENSSVEFKVEPGWETVSWSSQKVGSLGSANAIMFSVTQPDSIFVRMANSMGCEILRRTAVKISRPQLNVAADHYKIMNGGAVQLQVTGAQRYSWAPTTGLDQSDISNPLASPTISIQYLVTGYDSLDCSAQASVTVTVENTGFIPNLFSPNDDGQNDQLKIYGLGSVQRFSFSIYDREGALVYKTSDVSEAVQQGWDGTKNGNKQPPGVYFWKVKGEISTGQLLLNGKESGSLVLIR